MISGVNINITRVFDSAVFEKVCKVLRFDPKIQVEE